MTQPTTTCRATLAVVPRPHLLVRVGSTRRHALIQQARAYLLGEGGDMVERGLIMVAIVVAALALWFSIGSKLAKNLRIVNGMM